MPFDHGMLSPEMFFRRILGRDACVAKHHVWCQTLFVIERPSCRLSRRKLTSARAHTTQLFTTPPSLNVVLWHFFAQKCANVCAEAGHLYMGVMGSNHCGCGSDPDFFDTPKSEGTCDLKCTLPGSSEECGGEDSYAIFVIED